MQNAVVLGTFDGVHTGHRAVISAADNLKCVAVTFSVPPKAVISGDAQLLMTLNDRSDALKNCGVHEINYLDFASVCDISAEDFLKYIKENFSPYKICCGFNYRFGKDAQGDSDTISAFCKKNGIEFCVVKRVEENGVTISSTYLRDLIKSGNVKTANKYIYGGFGFTECVVHGDKRGRTIGFPTINQSYPKELVRPKSGVYASKVIIDGNEYKGITNIGIRPTFATESIACETYIPDFSDNVYGKNVTLKPMEFLREERNFSSLEQLKTAISADVAKLFEKTF